MINTEKVNSNKGFELTTSFKKENLIQLHKCLSNQYKTFTMNEISYRTNTKVNTIVLLLKCFGFLLSESSFREPCV